MIGTGADIDGVQIWVATAPVDMRRSFDGPAIYYKRLESGTFQFPTSGDTSLTIDRDELMRLLRGFEIVRERIKAWLDAESEIVLPRSPMSKAIIYAQNQWSALCVYTTQGFLAIDNNAAERALKRVALGRKNWLFAGNDAAASNHAKLWTLIASCERHGIDPQRYLTSLLAKIRTTPSAELDQFLPDVWKADDAAEPEPTVS